MAPKRNNDDMTAEQKLELQRKRNRDKQAALRARRAARLKELEEENARLAGASASSSSSPPPPPAEVASASMSAVQGGGATYEGAVGRLVNKLRQLGVSEAEIHSLLSGETAATAPPNITPHPGQQPGGQQPAQRGTKRTVESFGGIGHGLIPSTAAFADGPLTSAWTTATARSICKLIDGAPPTNLASAFGDQSTLGASFDASVEPPTSLEGSVHLGTDMSAPFPFSFLFSEGGAVHSDVSSCSPPEPTAGALYPSPSLSSLVSTSSTPDSSVVPPPLAASTAVIFAPPLAPPTSHLPATHAAFEPSVQDRDHLSALESSIKALFEKLKNGPKVLGGREGLFKRDKAAQQEADKDMAATQLLILQLLGATSSQKAAYDAQCALSPHAVWLLEHEDYDPRLDFIPNPALRVRLGQAAKHQGLDLTKLLHDMIEGVKVYGDVWDWTGWRMPDDFTMELPVDTQTDALVFPVAVESWTPKGPALRPKPEYLTGSSVREIILGLEKPGAREAGPFSTTCMVQLVDSEILVMEQA